MKAQNFSPNFSFHDVYELFAEFFARQIFLLYGNQLKYPRENKGDWGSVNWGEGKTWDQISTSQVSKVSQGHLSRLVSCREGLSILDHTANWIRLLLILDAGPAEQAGCELCMLTVTYLWPMRVFVYDAIMQQAALLQIRICQQCVR